jgi:hypothetical protein
MEAQELETKGRAIYEFQAQGLFCATRVVPTRLLICLLNVHGHGHVMVSFTLDSALTQSTHLSHPSPAPLFGSLLSRRHVLAWQTHDRQAFLIRLTF